MGSKIPNVIIGLGNYGSAFDKTRHNVGFDVLDILNSKNKSWNPGEHGLWCLNDFHHSIMVRPITGMNESGLAVRDAYQAINGNIEKFIVIYDDMDFGVGEIKIKVGGGDGGHNGIKSIISHVGNEFVRIRIGIGKPQNKDESLKFVLGKFSNKERKVIDVALQRAAEAVSWIIQDGVQKAMAHFNKK
jgi:PTH1 family peptidyl-tRNA hydrolase